MLEDCDVWRFHVFCGGKESKCKAWSMNLGARGAERTSSVPAQVPRTQTMRPVCKHLRSKASITNGLWISLENRTRNSRGFRYGGFCGIVYRFKARATNQLRIARTKQIAALKNARWRSTLCSCASMYWRVICYLKV